MIVNGRAHHEQLSTELAGRDETAGRSVFRARCSCGWISEPVDAGLVLVHWQEHYEDAAASGV